MGLDVVDRVGLGPVDVPLLHQVPMKQQMREKMIVEFEEVKAGL